MATAAPAMPGMGFVLPQFQGDAMRIQRQQALAQALMQQSMVNQGEQMNQVGAGMKVMPRVSPFAPLLQALTGYEANKMGNDTIDAQNQLGRNEWAALTGNQASQSPYPAPQTPPAQPDPGTAPPQTSVQPPSSPQALGGALLSQGAQPQGVPPQATTQPQALPPQQGPQTGGPTAQGGGQLPLLAPGGQWNPLGANPNLAFMSLQNNPGEFFKSQLGFYAPTDATRMATAGGVDVAQANKDALSKATYIPPTRLGEGAYADGTGAVHGLPTTARPGFVNIADPNDPSGWRTVQIGGGLPAVTASEAALKKGVNQQTSKTLYDANNNPINGTEAQAIDSANNGNGVTGGNSPVQSGRFGGYTAPNSGVMRPAPALGATTAADAQSSQNTKRSGALVDAASDSPTRVNVLDNIINLSKGGVATGPTQEWQNTVRSTIGDLTGNKAMTDQAVGFQEMKKYMMQNGLRAWQAAGGSGTDSQLSAAQQANPNDKMFPQAVQTMAQWAKAGEVALQAKASAQDDWLSRNANNPQAQNQFESTWRKNFDPRVYQMSLMPPADRAAYIAKQPDASTLKAKVGTALQNGWVQ